jgi:hypothetical protein
MFKVYFSLGYCICSPGFLAVEERGEKGCYYQFDQGPCPDGQEVQELDGHGVCTVSIFHQLCVQKL